MMSAGSAQAASEVAQLAAGDNRLGIIATLALPALGWVAFNIGGPALNQMANMDKSNKMRYRPATLSAAQCCLHAFAWVPFMPLECSSACSKAHGS